MSINIDQLKTETGENLNDNSKNQVQENQNSIPASTEMQERRPLNPQNVGIKTVVKEEKNDIDDILEQADIIIDEKIQETSEFIEAAKDLNGELTVEEFDEMKNNEKEMESTPFQEDNTLNNILDDIGESSNEKDIINVDEFDSDNTTKSLDEDIPNLDSLPKIDDDDFDDDDSSDLEDSKEEEEKQKLLFEDFKKDITDKLSGNVISLNGYKIINKPAAFSQTLKQAELENCKEVFDWPLINSNKCISMKKFTGTELEQLADPKGKTPLHVLTFMWNLIYSHISDINKPKSLEKWLKTTSALDISHIWMAIYNATFAKSNHIPYDCTNADCNHAFLSDSVPIMDMVKFEEEKDRILFNNVLNKETDPKDNTYESHLVPLSDTYAFSFKEPSIWDLHFEQAYLDEDFSNKYSLLINVIMYIDKIYFINKVDQTLQPLDVKVYPNNVAKTIKSKIRRYAEVISTLDADEYATIGAYAQSINDRSKGITYVQPQVTCPKCGSIIEASEVNIQQFVFTRHQLGVLKNI